MYSLTNEESNVNEITSQSAEVSTQNVGLQSSESTPESIASKSTLSTPPSTQSVEDNLGSQSTGDSTKVNSQSQTFELEDIHLTAEQLLALSNIMKTIHQL